MAKARRDSGDHLHPHRQPQIMRNHRQHFTLPRARCMIAPEIPRTPR